MNFILDRLFISMGIISFMSIFGVMVHYAFHPNAIIYPNRIFPLKLRERLWLKLVLGLVIFCFFANLASAVQAELAIVFAYLKGMAPIITKEFKVNAGAYKTIDTLRTVRNLPSAYRALELYHKVTMEFIGCHIIPVELVIDQLALTCNFILIRHGTKLSLVPFVMASFWALVFQSFWIIFLNLSGLFLKHSTETIESWKYLSFSSSKDEKCFKRFRKSCRPLKIGHGRYYSIKRITVLTFLRGIMRGTFRAVLTLRHTNF